ncbi:MAG: lysostaphin resistance A-like protein [Cellulosilyticaceae bacterium]
MIKVFKAMVMILGTIVWFFGTQQLIALVISGIKGMSYAEEHTFLITLLSYVLCLAPYVVRIKKEVISEAYQLERWWSLFKYVGYGILLWLGSGVINLVCLPFFPEYTEEIGTLFVTQEPVLRFIVLVIGAPLVEEFLFRGKIQGYMEVVFGKHLAIIAQALIFGMVHPFGLQKIYASFLGIGLGYIRARDQKLVGPTIMHMMVNGIGWLLGTLG